MSALSRGMTLLITIAGFVVPAVLAIAFPLLYHLNFKGIPTPWSDLGRLEPAVRIETLHAYGRDALNNLTLINGGAIIAILTFLGHMFSTDDSKRFRMANQLTTGMIRFVASFAAGLVLSVLSGFIWYTEMLRFLSSGPSGLLFVATYLEGASMCYFVAGTFFAALAFHSLPEPKESDSKAKS
jgi:hypothetical protein